MRTLLLIALTLTACSPGSSKVLMSNTNPNSATSPIETNPPISFAVMDAANLPACDSLREGSLAYIQSTEEFQVCNSGNWVQIDITGPTGPAGAPGGSEAQGPEKILYATANISSADLQNHTAIDLIPAPGPGHYIKLLSVDASVRNQTVPYAQSDLLSFGYASDRFLNADLSVLGNFVTTFNSPTTVPVQENAKIVAKSRTVSVADIELGSLTAAQVNFYASSFALNENGIPLIAYADTENGNKLTVKKFDGTN